MIYLSSNSYFIKNANYLSISQKEGKWYNIILDDIRDSIYSTEESRFCNDSIINTYNIGDYISYPGRYTFKKYYNNNIVSRGYFDNKANEADAIIMLMREFTNKEGLD